LPQDALLDSSDTRAGQVRVARRDDRLARRAPRAGRVEGLGVPPPDALDQGVDPLALHRRQVRRAQERHRDAPRRHLAPRVVERHDEAIDVEGAVGPPGEAAHDAHPEPVEQRVRDVEA
jgi:hypothetical protein